MARILAVDDSRSMREMVAFTLESAGHAVTPAVDGVDALRIAEADAFDLVLMDVNMPNMDGITCIAKLRELNAFKFVPMLMLTTETSTARKHEAKTAGATGWLSKPFNPEKLLATIDRVTG